jgi:hypothetical protein
MQQRQGTLRSTMMATPSADAGPRQRALLLRPGLRPARDLPAGSNLRSFDASWHKRRRERLCSPKVHGLMELRGKHTIKHINHVFVRPSRRRLCQDAQSGYGFPLVLPHLCPSAPFRLRRTSQSKSPVATMKRRRISVSRALPSH